jgi:enamine deaminase RidA (YjgF/YER057c/UK114 family)
MAGAVEQTLATLCITLNAPRSPVANYTGFVRTGNLLMVSGQLCFGEDGKLVVKGKLGAGVTVEEGSAAARACGVNLLAQAKAALGTSTRSPAWLSSSALSIPRRIFSMGQRY